MSEYDAPHGTPSTATGWTLCFELGSDRPVYEADLLVCRHCGYTIFMCDSVTKKPLPASVVAEKCSVCDKRICGRCALKMRSGDVCSYFIHKIDAQEEAFRRRLKLGSYG